VASPPGGDKPVTPADTRPERPHVLVLGGGFAGVGAARKLKHEHGGTPETGARAEDERLGAGRGVGGSAGFRVPCAGATRR
jgi:hypothetical protein